MKVMTIGQGAPVGRGEAQKPKEAPARGCAMCGTPVEVVSCPRCSSTDVQAHEVLLQHEGWDVARVELAICWRCCMKWILGQQPAVCDDCRRAAEARQERAA